MAAIHKALDESSTEHPVFYEDKVDIHLYPKSVQTGNCAGSKNKCSCRDRMKNINWPERCTVGQVKSAMRGQEVDNNIIHKSRETQRWLQDNPKFRVIYQPVYLPWVNYVERLWQTRHDIIMCNHQCSPMWQLLKKVRHFMETVSPCSEGKHELAKAVLGVAI